MSCWTRRPDRVFTSPWRRAPTRERLFPRGGGLRKIRWKLPGRGKRGGMRAIYFVVRDERVYILTAYAKSEKKDLTKDEIKELRALVKGL